MPWSDAPRASLMPRSAETLVGAELVQPRPIHLLEHARPIHVRLVARPHVEAADVLALPQRVDLDPIQGLPGVRERERRQQQPDGALAELRRRDHDVDEVVAVAGVVELDRRHGLLRRRPADDVQVLQADPLLAADQQVHVGLGVSHRIFRGRDDRKQAGVRRGRIRDRVVPGHDHRAVRLEHGDGLRRADRASSSPCC